ncbi:MAG TPA: YolD-like family protein [Firmicutes bacterium]|nr:YolD-like family protein [Bacillota bacterium]
MKKESCSDQSYNDIINRPHHRSPTRPRMPRRDRAAQFSPFAALSGHEAAIEETERLTEKRITLSEEAKARLNTRLLLVAQNLGQRPHLSITYFLPDARKSGGAYLTETGTVKKIDRYRRIIILENEVAIPIEDITCIDGGIFSAMP